MIILKATDCKGIQYPPHKYMFYTLREAQQKYRLLHGLKGKKLLWV